MNTPLVENTSTSESTEQNTENTPIVEDSKSNESPTSEAPASAPETQEAAPPTTTPEATEETQEASATEAEDSEAPAEGTEKAWLDVADEEGQTPAGAGVIPGAKVKKTSNSGGAAGVITQFVIFPLVIVISIVLIFGFFNWALQDNRTYGDYIRAINSGWESERWQAAYELQFRLTDRSDNLRKTVDVPETLRVYENSKSFKDQRVRAVLTIILGYIQDPAAEGALLQALEDSHAETRLNAVFSLGRLKSTKAVPSLIALLKPSSSLDKTMRDSFNKIIAYSLGEIGDRSAIEPLCILLKTSTDDVRWNAALALARFKDKRALPTLRAMLDRRYLEQIQTMRPKDRDRVMINALRGVRILNAKSLESDIQYLAESDKSYKVRQAALEVLDAFNNKTNKP